MTGEAEIGVGVMRVLAGLFQQKGTIKQIIDGVPLVVALSETDQAPSPSRPGEQSWHQIVRNLESHRQTSDNPIRKGYVRRLSRGYYQLTANGVRYLGTLGFTVGLPVLNSAQSLDAAQN